MRVGTGKGGLSSAALAVAGFTLAMLAVIVFAPTAWSSRSTEGKSNISPHKLAILFTGDDLGNIKPCG